MWVSGCKGVFFKGLILDTTKELDLKRGSGSEAFCKCVANLRTKCLIVMASFMGGVWLVIAKKPKSLKKGNCATAFSRLNGFRGGAKEGVWCY